MVALHTFRKITAAFFLLLTYSKVHQQTCTEHKVPKNSEAVPVLGRELAACCILVPEVASGLLENLCTSTPKVFKNLQHDHGNFTFFLTL
jgi:hypothetical protein